MKVLSGPATLSANIVTLTGLGSVRLVAQQAGNAYYYGATPVTTSFKVTATPEVTSLKWSQGVLTKPYAYQITATGIPTGFTLTGTIPPGLSFDPVKGLLSGTPLKAGTYNLVMGVTSPQGSSTTSLRVVIVENVPHLYVANYSSGTVGEYTTADLPSIPL